MPQDGLHSVTDRLGPRLREEFEQLAKSERKLLRALTKPEIARQFAADPLGALASLKIDVPPVIKQRLKTAAITGDAPDLHHRRSFQLPDGQVLTPTVTIRFTGSSEIG